MNKTRKTRAKKARSRRKPTPKSSNADLDLQYQPGGTLSMQLRGWGVLLIMVLAGAGIFLAVHYPIVLTSILGGGGVGFGLGKAA